MGTLRDGTNTHSEAGGSAARKADGDVSRRDALRLGAFGAAGLMMTSALGACAASGSRSSSGAAAMSGGRTGSGGERKRLLRLAHLTDFHIQPERGATEGVAACLRHAQSMKDPPQVIVTGGDLIMDGYDAEFDRTKRQWEIWQKVLKDECSLPIVHTLGNHDIWGWHKKRSKTSGSEAKWGKRWACEMVERDEAWYAADVGDHVRLVILDSVQPHPTVEYGYAAYCDEAQWNWLQRTLANTGPEKHVIVVSHIPIVSTTAMVDAKQQGVRTEDLKIGRNLMHADASRLVSLFKSRGNVRACLSGHMHLIDRVEMNAITYLCNGAVCGGWWKGPNQDCRAGYAIVDLFNDGGVERQYVTYDWAYRV